ncbi:hypothetical protein ACCAA_570002 [Candidatus Accumulibacter aalborgensis]|uniref:Uncharacterized protein n=1 Tax=Candidatus Accumulibacter aalborgensis TaxID=1860102 RepID=A0A1A8XUX8_9PROT|nr:hypothetical protein ACCAA_570002 [Candidatus Accumulibacter aalborgensis]
MFFNVRVVGIGHRPQKATIMVPAPVIVNLL